MWNTALNIVKVLARSNYGFSMQTLVGTKEVIVVPILNYAAQSGTTFCHLPMSVVLEVSLW